jgi:hypothetical protein
MCANDVVCWSLGVNVLTTRLMPRLNWNNFHDILNAPKAIFQFQWNTWNNCLNILKTPGANSAEFLSGHYLMDRYVSCPHILSLLSFTNWYTVQLYGHVLHRISAKPQLILIQKELIHPLPDKWSSEHGYQWAHDMQQISIFLSFKQVLFNFQLTLGRTAIDRVFFLNVPVRHLVTRFEVENCIIESGPQELCWKKIWNLYEFKLKTANLTDIGWL